MWSVFSFCIYAIRLFIFQAGWWIYTVLTISWNSSAHSHAHVILDLCIRLNLNKTFTQRSDRFGSSDVDLFLFNNHVCRVSLFLKDSIGPDSWETVNKMHFSHIVNTLSAMLFWSYPTAHKLDSTKMGNFQSTPQKQTNPCMNVAVHPADKRSKCGNFQQLLSLSVLVALILLYSCSSVF